MSQRLVPDWIEGYVEYMDNTEPPEMYHRWCAVSCMAAVLQRKCWLDWGVVTFYPNFYVVLVGPPAARKGSAMEPVRQFLERLNVEIAADESSRQKLVSALQKAGVAAPGNGVVTFHASLTIFSSELTVFLGYQNIELLTILCDWFDCRSRFIYDTHMHGRQEVQNVWVNLLGATTPILLQTSLPEGAVGSGFTSRTVFVYEENKGKLVILPMLNKRQNELKELLYRDLETILGMHGQFVYTDGFLKRYEEWRIYGETHAIFTDPKLEFYAQRRQVHLLKLCMVFSASRSDSMVIEMVDLERAIEFLERTEKKMPLVFRGVGTNPLASAQTRIMQIVEDRQNLSLSELVEMFASDVTNYQMGDILTTLDKMGFCYLDIKEKMIRYGQPKTL